MQYYGDIAQLGEHLPCTQGVRSSNLLISTRCGERGTDKRPNAKTKWAHSSGG